MIIKKITRYHCFLFPSHFFEGSFMMFVCRPTVVTFIAQSGNYKELPGEEEGIMNFLS